MEKGYRVSGIFATALIISGLISGSFFGIGDPVSGFSAVCAVAGCTFIHAGLAAMVISGVTALLLIRFTDLLIPVAACFGFLAGGTARMTVNWIIAGLYD